MNPALTGRARSERAESAGIDFVAAPAAIELAADEVHLWLWNPLEAIAPRDVSARANAQLLRLLGRYGGTEPPSLQRGEHGKPYLPGTGFPQFNLSHGGHCMLFAFSKQQAIGVDVDTLSRRHAPLELARRFFAEEEARALEKLDGSLQGAAFMRLWTCKEAVLKSLGMGLSFGLHRLRFELDENGRAGGLQAIDGEVGTAGDWQLHRFEPAPGHVAALAWQGPALRIRGFRLGEP